MASISNNRKYNRVVALIDLDCFYCQVEEVLNPNLKGKPIIVQPLQYDDFGGGGIIALNYVARARGVKREMRGDEAKRQCPELEMIRVPVVRGKADLSKYRNAGKQVAAVLQTFTPLMSRASVDEAYLDITRLVKNRLIEMTEGKFILKPDALENTFVVEHESICDFVQCITNRITVINAPQMKCDDVDLIDLTEEDRNDFKDNDIKLLVAASITNEIRNVVKEKTGYECSAGIAHNKAMAKMVCGLNKPNKQTIIPLKNIPQFFSSLPIKKVQGLGGKFGEKVCTELNVEFMGDLIHFSRVELTRPYNDKSGNRLYNLARGIDFELVTEKLISKSIACSKKFPGRNALSTVNELQKWLHEIADDVSIRIEQDELENNRRPKQMSLNFMQLIDNKDVSSSRTVNLFVTDKQTIVNEMMNILKKNTFQFLKSPGSSMLNNPIKYIGLSVFKFEDIHAKQALTIKNLFQQNVYNEMNSSSIPKLEVVNQSPTENEKYLEDMNLNIQSLEAINIFLQDEKVSSMK